MAKILAISSFVALGTVGLKALGPAVRALGHELIELPTVLLSNHPGLGAFARQDVDAPALRDMLAALDANGWLNDVAVITTGYLPDEERVNLAREAVDLVRRRAPDAVYLCDPIFGDDPKGFYLPREVAKAIGVVLVPVADVATPNRFELAYLAGRDVMDPETAAVAARALPCRTLLATSIPEGGDVLATMLVVGKQVVVKKSPRFASVPHGTGDFLAGLVAGWMARGMGADAAFERSYPTLAKVVSASQCRSSLDFAELPRLILQP